MIFSHLDMIATIYSIQYVTRYVIYLIFYINKISFDAHNISYCTICGIHDILDMSSVKRNGRLSLKTHCRMESASMTIRMLKAVEFKCSEAGLICHWKIRTLPVTKIIHRYAMTSKRKL